MARLEGFPATLSTIAEQVYFAATDRKWTGHDESSIVRLWTEESVSSIESSLSAEAKEAKLKLVVNLLIGIHLVAAAESIGFAKHVGLPLPQLFELAVEAAGGSSMFKSYGEKIIQVFEGKSGSEESLQNHTTNLKEAVDEAQKIKCSLYLGGGALNLLLASGKNATLEELLRLYIVK